jgi:hypothetical protein
VEREQKQNGALGRGKGKNCVLTLRSERFLCGKPFSFFFAASKKGDSNALTSDSPFALWFFYYRACLLYVYPTFLF